LHTSYHLDADRNSPPRHPFKNTAITGNKFLIGPVAPSPQS
jgi:hypothetical protein